MAKEAATFRQLAELVPMIAGWLRRHSQGSPFVLRPSMLLTLHRLCTADVQPDMTPGLYRNRQVKVKLAAGAYVPPCAEDVPGLVEHMCETVNLQWTHPNPARLVAYVLFQVSWVHPFLDGNGRVARALAYAVMCMRLGRDPGLAPLIPSQFSRHRKCILEALSRAQHSAPAPATPDDAGMQWDKLNLSALEAIVIKVWPPLSPELFRVPAAVSDVDERDEGEPRPAGSPSDRPAAENAAIREQLQCSICHDIMLDPVTAPRCGHSFCKRCIVQWCRQPHAPTACPSCRARLPREGALVVSVTLRGLVQHVFPEEVQQRRAQEPPLPPKTPQEGHRESPDDESGAEMWDFLYRNQEEDYLSVGGVSAGVHVEDLEEAWPLYSLTDDEDDHIGYARGGSEYVLRYMRGEMEADDESYHEDGSHLSEEDDANPRPEGTGEVAAVEADQAMDGGGFHWIHRMEHEQQQLDEGEALGSTSDAQEQSSRSDADSEVPDTYEEVNAAPGIEAGDHDQEDDFGHTDDHTDFEEDEIPPLDWGDADPVEPSIHVQHAEEEDNGPEAPSGDDSASFIGETNVQDVWEVNTLEGDTEDFFCDYEDFQDEASDDGYDSAFGYQHSDDDDDLNYL
eukprot:CAMPEP_0114262678 /NCGR_PEP_ID=MMETSP0058-20121206/21967_1 /TAXON_ID=36894 /ORGANISM="Pyramimonas parkeae, CCMP726" /LENGTH=622 /DNA_ID=CAMNT_0001378633 /DNA_START=381 /DNA_END=2249 /DNA_ORIENTATION=-